MFHGQPYCGACGYEGPDFMWMWHFNWGLSALVQDRDTLELRTVHISDNEAFYRQKGQTSDDLERKSAAYVSAFVAGNLRPAERHVPPDEFAQFTDSDEDTTTDLPCPRCRSRLLWRHTGIS